MRLCIKEKEFSWQTRFVVKQEDGSDKYVYVRDGRNFCLRNTANEEVARVQTEIWDGMRWNAIYIGGQKTAAIRKDVKLFSKGKLLPEEYILAGLDWEIEGNVGAWEHDILRNGQPIAHIARECFTLSPSWVLDIADPADEIPVLMVVLTIDCVGEAHRNDPV